MTGDRSQANEQPVAVWIIDLDERTPVGRDRDALTELDRAQASRLHDTVAGARLTARRSATRSIIGETLGIAPRDVTIHRRCPTCGSEDHGRPYVVGAPLNFSVSSSAEMAAVATSDGTVGVDLEIVVPHIEPSTIGLTTTEQQHLETLPFDARARSFVRLWTVKEAVLKSCGLSLADDPASIDATNVLTRSSFTVYCDGADRLVRQWTLNDRSEREVILTIASSKDGPVNWHGLPASVPFDPQLH
jgi:phosphopantetheinyl transferase